jgi:type IV secretory pathway VirJ component
LDPSGAQGLTDGLGVNAQAVADPDQRQAALVEADGMVDLVVAESALAHTDAVAVQVLGDGGAVDPEPGREFVDAGPGSVGVHQLRDLGRWEGRNGHPLSTDCTQLVTDGGLWKPVHPFSP